MAYGIGTRSDNRTPEATQRRRAQAKHWRNVAANGFPKGEEFDAGAWRNCNCRSFRHPHNLSAHKKLRAENDWRHYTAREQDTFQEWEKPL